MFRKPELYTMRGAPFTKEQDGRVIDRSGAVIDLFPGVREALLEIHRADRFRGTRLAIASRTSHKRWGTVSVCGSWLGRACAVAKAVTYSTRYALGINGTG